MWFTSLVLKNLWRRKIRSVLTATSMAIAVCAVLAMLGTADGYEQSFAALYEARGTDLIVSQAGKAQAIASKLDEDLGKRIKQIPGVRDVEGAFIDLYSFPETPVVYVFGLDPNSVLMEESKLKQGRKLTHNDSRKVAMGSALARNLNKKMGDTFDVIGEPFEIVCIYDSFNLLESNGAVVPLREMQEVYKEPGKVTTFLILFEESHKNPVKLEEIRKQLEALRKPNGKPYDFLVQTTRDHVKANQETQLLKGLAWASSVIAMLIGFVSMLNTMMMSITERIREIATFRAIGWRKLRIMRMIFLESLVLSTVGAAFGVLLAIPLMEFLANFSATSSLVVSRITLDVLGKGVSMGLLAGLLGAIYPAWIAANLNPASALRHE
jgi:putative ABC transport system permease protein